MRRIKRSNPGRVAGALFTVIVAVTALMATTPSAQAAAAADAPLIWLGSPVDGRWSSYEGGGSHHRVYGGDWAIDLETGAGQAVVVYAAPQNSGTTVTATVDAIGSACRNGNGGNWVRVAFYSAGTRIGHAIYGHINPTVSPGQTIARWGTTIGHTGSYTPDSTCWSGPHVHFELYSASHYACYNRGYALGQPISRTNFIGFTGGNVAAGPAAACA